MKSINFNTCLRVNDKIWFISVEGYLMNYNCITYQTEIVYPINLQEVYFKQVIDEMVAVDDKIYFVEQDGSRLYEYNIESNFCNYYSIPAVKFINWGCFAGIYLFGNSVYLFPRALGTVYRFDTVKKKFFCLKIENRGIVMRSFRVGNKVYLYDEKIVCFHLADEQVIQEYNWGGLNISWMYQYLNEIYILSGNNIFLWNENENSKKIIYEENAKADNWGIFFVLNNTIFVLPNQAREIMTINRISGDSSFGILPDDLHYTEKGWSKYWGYTEDDRYVWCADRVSNYVLCIDKKEEKLKWIKLKMPDLDQEFRYLSLNYKPLYMEGDIPIVQLARIGGKSMDDKKASVGTEIWEQIKK